MRAQSCGGFGWVTRSLQHECCQTQWVTPVGPDARGSRNPRIAPDIRETCRPLFCVLPAAADGAEMLVSDYVQGVVGGHGGVSAE